MINVVVSLLDVEVSPILLPLKVNVFQIKQVLIVMDIDCFYFLLNRFLLVVLQQLRASSFHLLQLATEAVLDCRVGINLLFDSLDFSLNSLDGCCLTFVFVFTQKQLFAE